MNSPVPFSISWASKEDAELLPPLFSMLYKHDVPEAPEPPNDVAKAHIAQLLDPGTPHKLAIAWREDRTAVGLAAVAIFVSISDPRPDRWKQMELKELFILPEYRGARVGAALLDWVEQQAMAAGACRIDWHVKKENHRGISFYQRNGAHIVDNRLSMRKPLHQ